MRENEIYGQSVVKRVSRLLRAFYFDLAFGKVLVFELPFT